MFDNLRLVRTDFLAEYRDNTDLFLRVGNASFAAAIRDSSAGVTQTKYPTPWMLYHSWRAQRINIDVQSAEIIRELMAGATPGPRHAPIVRKLEELGWCDDDHSYEGCVRDFEIYNGLVAADGLIVFHDICVFPEAWPGNAVGEVWRELGPSHDGREIIDPDGVSHPGLKPGERWRWGIGIIEAANLTPAQT